MLAGYKTLVRLALNAYPSCLQAQGNTKYKYLFVYIDFRT